VRLYTGPLERSNVRCEIVVDVEFRAWRGKQATKAPVKVDWRSAELMANRYDSRVVAWGRRVTTTGSRTATFAVEGKSGTIFHYPIPIWKLESRIMSAAFSAFKSHSTTPPTSPTAEPSRQGLKAKGYLILNPLNPSHCLTFIFIFII